MPPAAASPVPQYCGQARASGDGLPNPAMANLGGCVCTGDGLFSSSSNVLLCQGNFSKGSGGGGSVRTGAASRNCAASRCLGCAVPLATFEPSFHITPPIAHVPANFKKIWCRLTTYHPALCPRYFRCICSLRQLGCIDPLITHINSAPYTSGQFLTYRNLLTYASVLET